MRKRLIIDSFIMAVVPVLTIITLSNFKGDQQMLRMGIAVAGALIQIPVVMLCKRDARRMFEPSCDTLMKMGVERIPCAYEPGRYNKDFKVLSLLLWLGIIAPFLACLAISNTRTYTVTILNFMTYENSDMNLMILAIMFILIGFMILPLWGIFGQAMVIANEGNDGKRYLYRGFAEIADEEKTIYRYKTFL